MEKTAILKEIPNISNIKLKKIKLKMDITMLDSIMCKIAGYYPLRAIYDDGIIKDIKDYLTAVYTAVDTNTAEIQLFFEITKDNAATESEENFRLRITDIQEF